MLFYIYQNQNPVTTEDQSLSPSLLKNNMSALPRRISLNLILHVEYKKRPCRFVEFMSGGP